MPRFGQNQLEYEKKLKRKEKKVSHILRCDKTKDCPRLSEQELNVFTGSI